MAAQQIKAEALRPQIPNYKRHDSTPEYFVEGISEGLLGVPLSKLTFHAVDGVDSKGVEQRSSTVRLVIPTVALLEMCRNLLAQGVLAKDQFVQGFDTAKGQLQQVLEGVDITALQPPKPSEKK